MPDLAPPIAGVAPFAAPERPRTAFGAAFAGLGIALPGTVVPNAPIAERLGVDDAWITSRTGIRERRFLAPHETLAELSAQAGAAALADAGLDAVDVDLLLLATCSGDDLVPGTAPAIGGLLGTRCGALDVGAACTGFLAGVQLAAAQIETGRADVVLVIGAEKLSAITDPADKGTAMIFADGAGAAVLTRTDGPSEVGPIRLEGEAQRDMLYADRASGVLSMAGYDVFQHAVSKMSASTLDALARSGCTLDDIDLFVYHQANTRIIRSVGQRLALPPEKVVDCIAEVGNVSAASLPLALAAARDEGRLFDGAKVLLSAFGAGFVWGAGVIDWRATA